MDLLDKIRNRQHPDGDCTCSSEDRMLGRSYLKYSMCGRCEKLIRTKRYENSKHR